MNKLLSASVLSLAIGFSASAMAAFQGPGLAPTSVTDALKLSDDTPLNRPNCQKHIRIII